MIIYVDEIPVEVIRKPIKNMYLKVHATTGLVKISAPLNLSKAEIQNSLDNKRDWLQKVRARTSMRTSPESFLNISKHSEKMIYLGKEYDLIFYSSPAPKKPKLEDNQLHCFVGSDSKEIIFIYLKQWCHDQMCSLLLPLIQKWQAIIGVTITDFKIKLMKSRWGSCHIQSRRICLNLRLIEKPLVCIEYVLVHELIHLLEKNHNKRFYALMTEFMPQWKCHQKQLEQ